MVPSALCWDATPLMYSVAAHCGTWLRDAAGSEREHVSTSVVRGELQDAHIAPPEWVSFLAEEEQPWNLDYAVRFATWCMALGANLDEGHNVGEASVAALAETLGVIAVVDDRDALTTIRESLQPKNADWCAHGSLWAISRLPLKATPANPNAVTGLCDAMLRAHTSAPSLGPLRWPFPPSGYNDWFKQNQAALNTACCPDESSAS